ncbi:MAG: cupin domain-containing protein [Chloroflexi bacterium]|nr:cupin domain-containing protein [Chloroflexota bacterium]
MPFYKLSELPKEWLNPSKSTGKGPNVTGASIEVGERVYAAGTGANPHTHPNEQICIVLGGRARIRILDEEMEVGPGDAWLVPASVEHEVKVIDELHIFSCKNIVDGQGHKNE